MSAHTLDGKGAAVALSVALRGQDPERQVAALQAYLDAGTLVRHFTAREVCPVGKVGPHGVRLQMPHPSLWQNIVQTLFLAEWIRSEFGDQPVHVNSGYRDPAYNLAVGGSTDSLHRQFNALDIWIDGVDPVAIRDRIESGHTEAAMFGVGVYDSFVHIDTRGFIGRPAPARWDERRRAA